MINVEMTEVSSRLGKFSVIKIGRTVLVCQCDTRMKILGALARGALTGEELTRETGLSYSAIMDHMEFLERLGVVRATRRKEEGKRRQIYFHLNEDPVEGIEELFLTARVGRVRQSRQPDAHTTV